MLVLPSAGRSHHCSLRDSTQLQAILSQKGGSAGQAILLRRRAGMDPNIVREYTHTLVSVSLAGFQQGFVKSSTKSQCIPDLEWETKSFMMRDALFCFICRLNFHFQIINIMIMLKF